jgi:hypothetical protein
MGKYDKYFITDTPPNPVHPETRQRDSKYPWVQYPFCVVDEEHGRVPGATWLEPNIVIRPDNIDTSEQAVHQGSGRPHRHIYDEYLMFLSLDPNNMAELGGEVELWMEDEKHLITKSTAVFIPKGTWHTPMIFRRVDRPFLFIAQANTLSYSHFAYTEDPKWNQDQPVLDEIVHVNLGGKKYQITASFMEHMAYMMNKYEEERKNRR